MKQVRIAAALALTAALRAGAAQAQVYSPPFMSPTPTNDFGVYVSDLGDVAIEGIWRRISRGGDIGLRAGYADTNEGALMLGIELRNPVILAGAPIGLAFTAGAQGLIGDVDALGLQAGLTIGHRFVNPGLALTPYIHPRIALIDGFAEDDDWETELLGELGLDAEFSQNLIFRLSLGLSDESPDVGLGLAWRR